MPTLLRQRLTSPKMLEWQTTCRKRLLISSCFFDTCTQYTSVLHAWEKYALISNRSKLRISTVQPIKFNQNCNIYYSISIHLNTAVSPNLSPNRTRNRLWRPFYRRVFEKLVFKVWFEYGSVLYGDKFGETAVW